MPLGLEVHHLRDRRHPALVGLAAQAERPAGLVAATGAADAMDVDLGVGGDIYVDHCFEPVDIKATGSDVGGHQHRAAAVGELDQHLVALALVELAVEGECRDAMAVQHVDEVAALLAGVAESQGTRRPVVLEQGGHRLEAGRVLDLVEALTDLALGVLLEQLHLLRLAQELARQPGDAFGVGGGEQQGLALGRAAPRDIGDVVVKAHVEHAVGLVEHQRIERLELEAAALEVVHEPPGRADDDVRAVLEARHLRLHRRAAAQRQHLDVGLEARQPADLLAHLVGQLARGAQHHRLHREAARVEPAQHRQRKGGGLAAAGLGLGDEVVAGQRQRQAGSLDRRHREVFELLQVLEQCRGERQGVEGDLGRGVGGGSG